jgi:hypothetical protein
MILSSISMLSCSCSNAGKLGPSNNANSAQASREGQLTQHEAEQSAIAEFEKHNGGAKVIAYTFDKLVYKDFPPGHSTMNGYFLCGQIEHRDRRGTKYGPQRIMVYIMKDFQPAQILYDYPERGRYVASSFCKQLQSEDELTP